MNLRPPAIFLAVALFLLPGVTRGQTASTEKKPAPADKSQAKNKQAKDTQDLGKSYAMLRPEQKRLIDDLVRRYNQTTGSKLVPGEAYDHARLSLRTTYDAVTHALLNAKMTDANGKSLGHAIDLVDAIDQVMGEEPGMGGDRQFRVYVYLKPNAVDTLARSQEFFRDKDNVVYHKGFPICFRLKHGPPSIQFSISRDQRMSDIDVDYRSSSFPQALFNGHLTAANSDVRAGNNLDRHDNRWAGLNGWWREVFGLLGTGTKPPKEVPTERAGNIPLNPGVKAGQGLDKSAHDFLQNWLVNQKPNLSVAYFSRRSYPCLEAMAQQKGTPVPPGMVRLRTEISMRQFGESLGTVSSVNDVVEAPPQWSQQLKEGKNAYSSEFCLVSVPADMAADEECIAVPRDTSGKPSKEKYFATAFRSKLGDSNNKLMSLLWAQEGAYWKIIAIRVDDSSSAGIVPKNAAEVQPSENEPKAFPADPAAVQAVTDFYQSWVVKRDAAAASRFASPRSYACVGAPSPEEKKQTPLQRIRLGLDGAIQKVTPSANLADSLSSVQPVNELIRPVEQPNSQAFAIMAVPDQMAASFLCQARHLPESTPELNPADAKYGTYYLSASRLRFAEEESPALLLLWTKEKSAWKVLAWAVEVP